MADVRPFRAVRYARPTEAVTAPPYDVIADDERAALLARDPHNVAHLTSEPEADIAGARLREWLAEGVLARDESPAVWWLEQDFVGPDGVARSRRGIVASLRAEPYSTGAVLPHERTHRGPIEGRLALLRATRTQLEPIFLLHEGAPPVDGPPSRPADLEVGGSLLWRLEGDHGVAAAFADRQLLIADGHHRYETAVEFAAEDGADRMLAVLVSTDDPGLVIFPTHRVFAARPDIAPAGEEYATVEDAVSALEWEPEAHAAAVLVRSDGARLLRGGEGELDVELVDRFGHEGIAYTPDREEAIRRVESGNADAALLVRPLQVSDVFERARAGRTLPQKATYFFPKLVSGLLLHPVDP
ncbi:MAG TPA: DUF1015 domain-containing protein [Gaiella sp.]|nr:DUF1015 domain-containing protein [Gaiella sp.]